MHYPPVISSAELAFGFFSFLNLRRISRIVSKEWTLGSLVSHLHKVKIKLSHVQQMTANQNIDGIHVILQLRGTVTYKPREGGKKMKSVNYKEKKKRTRNRGSRSNTIRKHSRRATTIHL